MKGCLSLGQVDTNSAGVTADCLPGLRTDCLPGLRALPPSPRQIFFKQPGSSLPRPDMQAYLLLLSSDTKLRIGMLEVVLVGRDLQRRGCSYSIILSWALTEGPASLVLTFLCRLHCEGTSSAEQASTAFCERGRLKHQTYICKMLVPFPLACFIH